MICDNSYTIHIIRGSSSDNKLVFRLFSLRFLLGILLLSAATWVAMTRLQDHFHHVIDVMGAALMGLLVPLFLLYSPLHFFKEEEIGSKCGEIGPLLANSS